MVAGPEEVFLGLRGLRTLDLRLREAERQGLAMAHWLKARPEVERVAASGTAGLLGSRVSGSATSKVRRVCSPSSLKPVATAALAAMLDGARAFRHGLFLGGATRAWSSRSIAPPIAARRRGTPGGPALRFSIGLEDTDDLQADLAAGFDRLRAAA